MMRKDSGGAVTSTTGLQHLSALRLRVVLERASSKRAHRSGAGEARATLSLEGGAARTHTTICVRNATHPRLSLTATAGKEPEVEIALV